MDKKNLFCKLNLKWLLIAVVIVLVLIIAGVLIYNYSVKLPDLFSRVAENQNGSNQANQNFSGCEVKEQPLKVNGNSLSGFIEDDAEMKALMNYYACNPVERGDIALYSYSDNKNPLIKVVKGIPGDKFQLKKTSADCWNILINGEISKNFQNESYCFNESGYKMLSLYEKDYRGIIPSNAYLIFGNLAGGSMDSSRFGLIGKQDLIGKAVSG
ncbi:MAG: signal peptidase I [Spirochaetia bacterium]|nr:MAG: signal peptidase I [Spirochaetia bacterium]